MARTPVVDYDARDFLSLTQRFRRYLNSSTRFSETWTSFNPEDHATAYLELSAYGLDIQFLYQEWIHNQAFVTSMTTRKAAIDNGALVGFELASASPATATVSVTVDVVALPFVLQARYQISNDETGEDQVFFEYDSDTPLTITLATLTGSDFIDLSFIEGQTITDDFGTSDGLVDQAFALSETSYIDGTLLFLVDGVTWTEIDSFAEAASSDEVYVVTTDEFGVTTATFGDGVFGLIPPLGDTLEATYRVGGGVRGRVSAGTLEKQVTTNPAVVSVTNESEAIGGEDAQTVSSARSEIPIFTSANDRFVTDEDHAVLGLLDGVNSVFVSSDPNASSKSVVRVIPEGAGETLTGSAISLIRTDLVDKGILPVRYEIRVAQYLRVIVEVRAKAASGTRASRVQEELLSKLTAELDFSTGGFTFGTEILLQDVYDFGEDVRDAGFLFTRFIVTQLRVQPEMLEFPGNTGSLDLDLTVITVDEDEVQRFQWEFHATDSRTFTVKRVTISRATSVAENVVTDGEGGFTGLTPSNTLRPRLDNPSLEYVVDSSTDTTVVATVPAGSSLQDDIEDNQQFGVVFIDVLEAFLGDVGTAGVASFPDQFTDATKSWSVDEWQNSILTDSSGATFTIASNTATVLTLTGLAASGSYTINEYTDSTSQITIVIAKGTILPVAGDIWFAVTTGYDNDVIVPDYLAPKVDTDNDLTVTVYGGIS